MSEWYSFPPEPDEGPEPPITLAEEEMMGRYHEPEEWEEWEEQAQWYEMQIEQERLDELRYYLEEVEK